MRRARENNFDVLYPENDQERSLSRFERALGEALLVGDDPRLVAGRVQLAGASVQSREFSGAGFFVNLQLAPDAPAGDPAVICNGLGNAIIHGPGIAGAMSLILARDGMIGCLEGVRWGDDPWPMELALRYLLDMEPEARITPLPGWGMPR